MVEIILFRRMRAQHPPGEKPREKTIRRNLWGKQKTAQHRHTILTPSIFLGINLALSDPV